MGFYENLCKYLDFVDFFFKKKMMNMTRGGE